MRKRAFWERKPEVVRRWATLKYGAKIDIFVRQMIRFKYSFLHYTTDKDRRNAHDAAIDSVNGALKRLQGNRSTNTIPLANALLFMLFAMRDLECLKIPAIFFRDRWSRLLYLRIMILTCYEWEAKIVFNKDLYDPLDKIKVNESHISELKLEVRKYRKCQERFAKKYNEIRNELIAHRPTDTQKYLSRMDLLSDRQVISDITELLENYETITQIMTTMLRQSGNFEVYRKAFDEVKQRESGLRQG